MSIFLNQEDNDKEVEKIIKQSVVEGEFISLTLGETEVMMKKALIEFNSLCKNNMPDILQWNHIDLYKASKDKSLKIIDWKNFIMDTRFQTWLNEEIYILSQAKKVNLLNKVGDNNSTATVQGLSALLRATENETNKIDDGKIFIYSFMPLTDEEGRLNNAQKLSAIPDEIKAALQYIPGGKS